MSAQRIPLHRNNPNREDMESLDCLEYLQQADFEGQYDAVKLLRHLELLASHYVLRFIRDFKPVILKNALANLTPTALDAKMLGGAVAALVAYDELECINTIICILEACEHSKVAAVFNHIH
jgi:hypothetical protein